MKVLIGTLCTCLLVSTANSALVEMDLFNAGDGLITLDTNTNLEWLDFNVANDLSFNEINNGNGGWLDLGFRYATTEFDALIVGQGMSISNGWEMSDDPEPVLNILDLFGETFFPDLTSDTWRLAQGNTGYFNTDIDGLGTDGVRLGQIGWQNQDLGELTVSTYTGGWSTELDNNTSSRGIVAGHWLVRNSSVVPIPAAVWLFGSGLIGLIGLARRKV